MDPNGTVASVRMRLALDGDNKFRWKTGSKPCLYGLWRLREVESKYMVLVEGESDAQTLWFSNFPISVSLWNDEEIHVAFERALGCCHFDRTAGRTCRNSGGDFRT